MGILRKILELFGRKEIAVYDLRGKESRRAEAIGYSGKSLGSAEADTLVDELVKIGRISEYYSSKRSTQIYDERGSHRRARQIGERLNEIGGIYLMQAAYYRIRAIVSPSQSQNIVFAWHEIGEWLC